MPVRRSVMKIITSACEIAVSAWKRMNCKISLSLFGSIPPVSIMVKSRPRQSLSAYRRSRVTPGVSSTMDRRLPASRLNSWLLPTFGRPTMATIGFGISDSLLLILRGSVFKYLRQQVCTVDLDRHKRHADGVRHLLRSIVVQKYVAAVAQHVSGNEHALAQIAALELCDQVLPGDQPCDRNQFAKEIVADG